MSVEKLHQDPDIYCIKIPLPKSPLRDLNCYVIFAGPSIWVIDTGFHLDACREAMLEGFKELGIRIEDTSLFLTHMHVDHLGQMEMFAEAGCPVYMSEKDIAHRNFLKVASAKGQREEFYEKNGFPHDEMVLQRTANPMVKYAAKKEVQIIPLRDGELLPNSNIEMRCILSPGHTPGHMCLFLPKQKILFTGDNVLFDITPNISAWDQDTDYLGLYMESLDKIDALDFEEGYPAHRNPRGDAHARLKVLKSHHHDRLKEVLGIINEQPGITAYGVASRMKWSIRCKDWSDFPVGQKWFAVGEALAHVIWLEKRGYIKRGEVDSLYTWYPGETPAQKLKTNQTWEQ